jgi:[protein-PII] uridylyltransferase
MREVRDPLPLYLGTLLHDVGKPLGKAHSETGARLALSIAARLGLDDATAARIEFLVRHHLLLAHLSQRRDLSDVGMIAKLAEQLGDEQTLVQLYLLTVADMSMVAPENLSSWKERLLTELFQRTLAAFRDRRRGPDLAGADASARVLAHKRRAAQLMGEPLDSLAPWFAGLPDRYFTQTPPRMISRQVELSRGRHGLVAVDLQHRRRRGWSELTVIADDAPGLLSKIAGVLLAAKASVLGARIATRTREGAPAETIDAFLVRDRRGQALDGGGAASPARIAAELERLIDGRSRVEELVEAALAERRRALPERVVPAVPTEVEVDNQVSSDFTVVDVYTHDRPGVLYTITRTLSQLGLDIHLSKVATEGNRVADVFYVRGPDGAKLDGERVAALKAALTGALAELG